MVAQRQPSIVSTSPLAHISHARVDPGRKWARFRSEISCSFESPPPAAIVQRGQIAPGLYRGGGGFGTGEVGWFLTGDRDPGRAGGGRGPGLSDLPPSSPVELAAGD